MDTPARLLTEVEQTIRTFVYLPSDHHYTINALWIAHTALRDSDGRFLPYITGRLYFGSSTPGCGKSLATKITTAMCVNGRMLLEPTPPSIIHTLNAGRGTVGLDEYDELMGTGAGRGTYKAIINGGYEKGATVDRVRADEIESLNVHGPMILTGKNLNRFLTSEKFATAKSRSFVMAMTERPAELADDFDVYDPMIHDDRLRAIGKRVAHTFGNSAREIVATDVLDIMPKGVANRAREIYRVLFQIAAFAGGEWPARIDAAARAFVCGEHDTDTVPVLSPADELYAACAAAFTAADVEWLPTADLIASLIEDNPRAWWTREWSGRSERAAAMSLSRMLRVSDVEHSKRHEGWGYDAGSFGVVPMTVYLTDDDD